ncbi:MAG: hypothetical protein ABIR80_04605 [Opitutaceae bacterium]
MTRTLSDAPPESAVPVNASEPADADEVARWLRRVKQLKQAFAEHPAQRIPQLEMLNDHDWVDIARDAQLETPEGLERALASARVEAKSRFTGKLIGALRAHLAAHGGRLPSDLQELLSQLDGPARDPAMLAQYELTSSGKLRDAPEGLIVKERSVVNDELENRIELTRTGDGSLTFRNSSPRPKMSNGDTIDGDALIERGIRAFASAHQGKPPSSLEDLLPFLHPGFVRGFTEHVIKNPMTPEQRKIFEEAAAELLKTPR